MHLILVCPKRIGLYILFLVKTLTLYIKILHITFYNAILIFELKKNDKKAVGNMPLFIKANGPQQKVQMG